MLRCDWLLPSLTTAVLLICHPPMPSGIFQTKHRTQTINQSNSCAFQTHMSFLETPEKILDSCGAEVAIHH